MPARPVATGQQEAEINEIDKIEQEDGRGDNEKRAAIQQKVEQFAGYQYRAADSQGGQPAHPDQPADAIDQLILKGDSEMPDSFAVFFIETFWFFELKISWTIFSLELSEYATGFLVLLLSEEAKAQIGANRIIMTLIKKQKRLICLTPCGRVITTKMRLLLDVFACGIFSYIQHMCK